MAAEETKFFPGLVSSALFRQTLFSLSGRALGVATALGATALLTRSLGSAGFGDYSLVLAFLTVFYVLADFGLGQLFVREISRPNRDAAVARELFTLRLTFLGVALALAPIAALFFPYSRVIVFGVVIASSGFFFLSLSQFLTGLFQRHLAMQWVALAEWAGRLVQLAGAAAVYWAYRDGFGGVAPLFLFLGAFAAGALAQFLILFLRGRMFMPFELAFSWARGRQIVKEALPLALSLVFVYIYFRTDTLILSVYHPGSAVGFYTLAYRVLENLIFLPAAFVGLVLPRLTEAWGQNPGRFRALFNKTLAVLAFTAPLASAAVFLFAPFVTRLLGGAEFAPAAEALRILSAASFFIYFAALPGQTVVAVGIQKQALWVYLAGAILNVTLNLMFIPKYSFVAAAWTTVATEGLVTAGLYFIVWRALKR